MPEIKQNFSGAKMNKDLDERIVPKGQYRDALNIKISTSDSDSGGIGSVGTVQNIQGNRQVTNTSATTSYDGKVSKIIASIADEGNDKVWVVPHNEDNRMYAEILEWVAEGNTIEEAD